MNNEQGNTFHKVKINNNQIIVSKYTTLNEENKKVNDEEIKIQFFNSLAKMIG